MEQIDRRETLRKAGAAAAVAGTAWVVPSIIGTSAYAAGSCLQEVVFDWGTLTAGTQVPAAPATLASYAAIPGYPALTISQSLAQVGTPGASSNAPATGFVGSGEFGGRTANYYRFAMNNDASGEGWTATFTFSNPVYNVRFQLLDIDTAGSATDGFRDLVVLTSPASFGFTLDPGGTVSGNGTSGTPWTGESTVDTDEDNGNVNVTILGPVSTFSISFLSGDRINANQAIGIDNITFCR